MNQADNATISNSTEFLDVAKGEYDKQLDTNLRGCFFVTQFAAKKMVDNKTKGGSIVNVASILGMRVGSGLSAYAISKAGVIQLTKASALELAQYGIRVNCIAPGYIRTEMNSAFFDSDLGKQYIEKRTISKRLGEKKELDGALLLLASDSGSFMTGSVLTVDGGHLVGSL